MRKPAPAPAECPTPQYHRYEQCPNCGEGLLREIAALREENAGFVSEVGALSVRLRDAEARAAALEAERDRQRTYINAIDPYVPPDVRKEARVALKSKPVPTGGEGGVVGVTPPPKGHGSGGNLAAESPPPEPVERCPLCFGQGCDEGVTACPVCGEGR